MRRSARRCWPHCECLGCGATASSGEGTGWPRGGARCGQGRGGRPPGRMPLDVHPRPSQRLQEREETAHRPEQGSESGLRVWGPQGGRGSICTSLESPPPPHRFLRTSWRSANGKEVTLKRRAWTGCWVWAAPGAAGWGKGGKTGRWSRTVLTALSSAVAPQAVWHYPGKTKRLPSLDCRCSR